MKVIVLLLPMGSSSARGVSLWNEYAPLIAVNTHWNAAARTFTLFHEYAHLLTRTNSACTGHVTARIRQGEDSLERWCEEFAAEFLAPWTRVRDCLVHDYDWRQGQTIDDLSLVKRLATKFHISLRAMTIKLIDHEVASWELYRQILPQVDDKRGGGGGEGRRRLQIRIDEYGERTAQVLLKGLERDVLSRTDVLGYLDIADSDLDILGSRVTTR
jgi:Zn-dependent peptidase ImmA (M78 family)